MKVLVNLIRSIITHPILSTVSVGVLYLVVNITDIFQGIEYWYEKYYGSSISSKDEITALQNRAQLFLARAKITNSKTDFAAVCIVWSEGNSCKEANKYLDAFNSEEQLIISELDSGSQCKLSMWQGSKNDADNSKHEIDSLSQINSSEAQAGSAKNRTESYLFQIDTVTGQNACSQAITDFPDDPEYQYLLGRVHHAKFEYHLAADYYKKAALNGHGSSYREIGFLYGGGKLDNGESNVEEAMKWFALGANKGFDEAKIAKAYYLQYGFEGVEQDTETAKTLLIEVYNKKSPKAALSLGKFYDKGFAKDGGKTTAFDYYRDAANWGETDGLIRQAKILFNGDLAPSSKKQDQDAVDLIKDAIDQDDNPWAYHYMGWAYANGRGLSQDNVEAIKFYKKAIERNYGYSAINISQAYSFGRLGLEKNLFESLNYHNIALDLGENDALLYRANLLFNGIFQPISDDADKQANRLIDEALRRGVGNWGHRLKAWAKLNGRGMPKNEEEARTELIKLYEKRKSGGAALILGNIYRDGLGVVADIEKAKGYYEKAELLGWSQGRQNRAWLLLNGIKKPISSTNDLVAFKLFSQNENEHNANILLGIGYLYEMGIGVHKDLAKAYKYYQQAYELGNSTAASNLGKLFRTGFKEQKPSPEKALNYFRRAIDWGYFDAYGDIADMLYDGEIFADADGEIVFEKPSDVGEEVLRKRSEKLAYNILKKGSKWSYKNTSLLNWLAWAYEYGRGVQKNQSEALRYRKLAAENGNNYSRRWLASRYFIGKFVEPDISEAKKYLNDAAENGDVTSIRALLWLAEGNGFYIADTGRQIEDIDVQTQNPDCEKSTDLHKKLLEALGKSRSESGVYDTFYDTIEGLNYSWSPGIDYAYCEIPSLITLQAHSIKKYLKFITNNKLANNLHVLSVLLDKTEAYLSYKTNSANTSKEVVDESADWMLEKFGVPLLNDDPRVACMRSRVLGIKQEIDKSLEGYLLVLSSESDLSKYNYFCNLSNFFKLMELNEGKYEDADILDNLEAIYELKHKLNDDEKRLLDMWLFAFDSKLGNQSFLNSVEELPNWEFLSFKIAQELLNDEKENEKFHWAGKVISMQVIYGNQYAEQLVIDNSNQKSGKYLSGLQSTFAKACIYEGAIDGKAGALTWSAFEKARDLGLTARTKDYHPEKEGVILADPSKEEYWSYCN